MSSSDSGNPSSLSCFEHFERNVKNPKSKENIISKKMKTIDVFFINCTSIFWDYI